MKNQLRDAMVEVIEATAQKRWELSELHPDDPRNSRCAESLARLADCVRKADPGGIPVFELLDSLMRFSGLDPIAVVQSPGIGDALFRHNFNRPLLEPDQFLATLPREVSVDWIEAFSDEPDRLLKLAFATGFPAEFRLRALAELERFLNDAKGDLVAVARDHYATWDVIGDALGVTRQAAQSRWGSAERSPASVHSARDVSI
jgi:hypothetical protein